MVPLSDVRKSLLEHELQRISHVLVNFMRIIDYIISFWNGLSGSEVISYAIGLFGILVSIIISIRSKRIQEPKFKKLSSVVTEKFISNNSGVHIKNGDKKLDILSISKVAFWNEGITLKREEISSKSPFRVELTNEEAQILDAYVEYAEEENDVSCKILEGGKQVIIHFDYLAKNQGLVLKILHTGRGSKDLQVKGAMKNTGKLRQSKQLHLRFALWILKFVPIFKSYIYMGYTFMLMGALLILTGLFSYGSFVEAHNVTFKDIAYLLFLGIITIVMGYMMQKREMPEKVSKALYNEL